MEQEMQAEADAGVGADDQPGEQYDAKVSR
jgi:hypothetical protein